MTMFHPSEILRYSRNFPVIGLKGQHKLKQVRVLCVGAGGLGCPALQYLAASGVGTIGVMDGDHVELSNLQRQILFTEQDVAQNKALVLSTRLQALNPYITVHAYPDFFSETHQDLLDQYDVVLDATDNYMARYTLNRICRQLNKAVVSASIYQFNVQLSVFNHMNGPCYQCLYPEPPPQQDIPNCSMGGVLGVVPGVAGTLQASETLKLILGLEGLLSGRLLCLDLATMQFNEYAISKQDCSQHPRVQFSQQISPPTTAYAMTSYQLFQLLQTSKNDTQLIDVRQPFEREICSIGGSILIPLATLSESLARFDKHQPIIIYCKSGGRSAQALQLFLNAGFTQVQYLEGGILQWQATVNPSLTRY